MVLAALFCLTFLYLKAHPVDPEGHYRILDQLRELEQLDATLNEEMLKIRQRMVRNYDHVVRIVERRKRIGQYLKQQTPAVYGDAETELVARLGAYLQLRAEQEVVLERLKGAIAAHRNSSNYLPVAALELSTRMKARGQEIALVESIEDILREMLIFQLVRDPERRSRVQSQIVNLLKASSELPPDLRTDIRNMGSHAAVILKYSKKEESLLADVLSAPIAVLSEHLYLNYTNSFTELNKYTAIYNGLLYALCILLIIYVLYVLIKLTQATASLAQANVNLRADINERQRVELALRASEARFRDIAEAASDWFWEMGPDLRFTYHSDRYFEITGFRPEDKIGTTRTRYVESSHFERDTAKWDAHFADLAARKRFQNFEYEFKLKDGSICHARISGQPVFNAEGKFEGYRGTGTDITERKRAEEAVRELSRQNELILSAAGEGIYGLDLEGRTTFINPAAAKIIGWEPDELIGQRQHDILHHSKPDGSVRILPRNVRSTRPPRTAQSTRFPTRCFGARTAPASRWSIPAPPSARTASWLVRW